MDNQKVENESQSSGELKPIDATSGRRRKKVIRESISIFLIVIGVFTFRSVFFEPFRIPSGSMIPTLMIGDFILVNKFAYGFKVPFSDLSVFDINWNPIYLFGEEEPKRGDVIVFKYPKDPAINYIKRVIGLPGDEIEIIDKKIHINGKPIPIEKIPLNKELVEDMVDKFKGYNLRFYKSTTGKRGHLIQQDGDNYFKTDYAKRKIPKGKYFVMGDNRDFSYDSRFWGFVPRENIKGRALFVWFSLNFPNDHEFKFRPHRIGTPID